MSGEGRFRFSPLLIAVALLAGIAGPAAAQVTGELRGKVQDADGNPLSGIAITLIKAGGKDNKQQTSDAQGTFQFADLSGVYIATTAQEPYGPVTCPGVRVVGQARQIEIRLMPKEGTEPSSCKAVP
ncbi:MAG TPA: carboxypeptidase-like regulatory domain-containing protein [Thermoanaerobaculia bacterium]|nr:carboxypeptidase-like regulatory domain-containing protein [Thermoanaerobaculia bacterium]